MGLWRFWCKLGVADGVAVCVCLSVERRLEEIWSSLFMEAIEVSSIRLSNTEIVTRGDVVLKGKCPRWAVLRGIGVW